jgi:hypothetical protein
MLIMGQIVKSQSELTLFEPAWTSLLSDSKQTRNLSPTGSLIAQRFQNGLVRHCGAKRWQYYTSKRIIIMLAGAKRNIAAIFYVDWQSCLKTEFSPDEERSRQPQLSGR